MPEPTDILQVNVRATRAPSRAIGVVFAGVLLVFAWPGRGSAESPPPAPPSSAPSPQVPEAQVQQLAALLAQMLPLGKMMDAQAARDPKWPLESKVDLVTPEQLACMRHEMSSDGWRQSKLAEAREYAMAHPERVAADLRILQAGAAKVTSRMVHAGLLAKEGGAPVDTKAALASVSAKQMHAFVLFAKDPGFAQLRELVGIENSFNKTREENQKASYDMGVSIGMKFTLRAMDDCKIPPATLM